jgi:hypothetical protein
VRTKLASLIAAALWIDKIGSLRVLIAFPWVREMNAMQNPFYCPGTMKTTSPHKQIPLFPKGGINNP